MPQISACSITTDTASVLSVSAGFPSFFQAEDISLSFAKLVTHFKLF